MEATEECTELLTRSPAIAAAQLLDLPTPDHELPPLWHWFYLRDPIAMANLGPDGHAHHGIEAPPAPGLTRMFAGGRVRTLHPLRCGDTATRTSFVLTRTEKQGRSGPLHFVTLRDEYRQAGELAITDDRDLVFRTPSASSRQPEPTAPLANQGFQIYADECLLFCFSALTYNPYRLHYDKEFCQAEGYSGPVIHGPLQAFMMAQQLSAAGRDVAGSVFSYRLTAPAIAPSTLSVSYQGVSAQVNRADGIATATAELIEQ